MTPLVHAWVHSRIVESLVTHSRSLIALSAGIPKLPLAFGACLAVTLATFISLKIEIRARARRERARIDAMLERLQEASVPPPAPEPAISSVAMRPGMNLARRTQAIRMLRAGESAAHIAAALGVPRAEVDLMIRVQEHVGKTHAAATGE